jgi:hypothetical protein
VFSIFFFKFELEKLVPTFYTKIKMEIRDKKETQGIGREVFYLFFKK